MSTLPLKVFHAAAFDKQLNFVSISKSYQYCDLGSCDLIIHHEISYKPIKTFQLIKDLKATYKTDKKIIIFVIHDFEFKYPKFSNIILIRTSLRASTIQHNEIVMPYIWECMAEPFPLSNYTAKPEVGFCGLISKQRKKLVSVFSKSNLVNCNFILRKKFWGGAPNDTSVVNDFYNNLKDNQYVLANRGAGNYSMRFYQALAAGRIPILINTDISLPFKEKINWSDCIIIEKDAKSCLAKTIEIHRTEKYLEMQKACSAVFNAFFSEANFFDHIVTQLRENLMLVPEIGESKPNLLLWRIKKICRIF